MRVFRGVPPCLAAVLNGKGDEVLFERGALATCGLDFQVLRNQAHINGAARAAHDSP